MKPRTKNEKEVTRLSALLPALSMAQKKWAAKNVMSNEGYATKTEIFCNVCGNTFANEIAMKEGEVTCPHCGCKIEVRRSTKRNVAQKGYLTILTTIKGWQVVRNIHVKRWAKKGHDYTKNGFNGYNAIYGFHEIGQVWLNAKGERVVMGVGRTMSSYYGSDSWACLDISIKHNEDYTFSGEVYPRISIIPILKRNGFKLLNDANQPRAMHLLLTDNRAETLMKVGYHHLFEICTHGYNSIDHKWHILKILLHHKYNLKSNQEWHDYFDYIGFLRQLGKDIHNPQYICPADFKAAHDSAMELVNKKREKERIEQERRWKEQRKKAEEERRKRDIRLKKAFTKSYKRFVGLVIVGKGISIAPLQTIEDFEAEGKAMHHCVAGYWRETGSLVLSARTSEGKRLETIEIDLKTFKIIQCRGVCNDDSPKHKEIIKLMNENMGKVMALAKPKKKTAKKPARARQAA